MQSNDTKNLESPRSGKVHSFCPNREERKER